MSPRPRFQDRWLSNESFKAWLTRVADSNTKAYCKICQKILSAEISSLKRHRNSKYHEDMCKKTSDKPTGSVSNEQPSAPNSDKCQSDTTVKGVTYATILMVVFIAEHNLPMRYNHILNFIICIYKT